MYILKCLALLGGVAVYASPTSSNPDPAPSSSSPVANNSHAPSVSPDQVQNLRATMKPSDDKKGCYIDFDMPALNCVDKTDQLLDYGYPWPHACWGEFHEGVAPETEFTRRTVCGDGIATLQWKSGELVFSNSKSEVVRFQFNNEVDAKYARYREGVTGEPTLGPKE
ncbi:hypothetical protein NUU61_001891 [Penicillium alfredii]|uniref:Uncharacterized protein n=1 Tax=Penicillium alfredii TaxID=1506179 RepID=A0A9W9FQH4_9EURO|nr:uncharacterized protein NUU61_001891 [Penicillium alfredii]KAJ5104544.1 hypothetical protein NUU61_001891 [Penicillium alfredii]